MIIPGFLIALLTFPGVIVHELAHELFCKLTRTPVYKVCYFQFGLPVGYVIHERPTNVWKHILIGVGPFLLNTLVGLVLGIAAALMHIDLNSLNPISGIYIWFAISIAMHSFPSTVDASSIWSAIWSKGAPISARLFGTPLVALIGVGAIGAIVWLDLAYGFMVVVGIPELLLPRQWTGRPLLPR